MDVILENIRIINSLQNRKKNDPGEDIYEMIEMVVETSSYNISKLHEEYIRNLSFVIPYIEKMYTLTDELEWPYHADSIFQGKYPLEKLPNHIRNLTKKLYYSEED
ncbi:MAG: hypothetical protein KDK36_14440 [Leptospiraceae bacterium]|nr:hypothetical protein [Leptospiraceae bacterium]